MGMTLAQYRTAVQLDLDDASKAVFGDSDVDRGVTRAIADLSRFLPQEKVYEVSLSFAVTSESWTSAAAHGTYTSLAYKPIKKGSVSITNAAGTTTYTENTDYTMDYTNGKVTTIDGGDMAVDTAYKANYTRSQLAVDISSLTDLIRVTRVEYVGQVPQQFCVYHIHANILYIDGIEDEDQTTFAEDSHVAIYYDAEHSGVGVSASSSHPSFLDNTVCMLAAAYCLFQVSVARTTQSVTDLASARTSLTSANTAHTALGTALTNIKKYLDNNTSADAAGILADITTDVASLRTAIGTALDALNAYVDSVATDLSNADGVWATYSAYVTGASEPSVKAYLASGDALINSITKGGENERTPEIYAAFAQALQVLVSAHEKKRQDYLQDATARTNAAMIYANEAAQRMSNLRSYIEQANSYIGIANQFAAEANMRSAEITQYLQQAQRYVEAAGGELVVADRYRTEAEARRDEVWSIWRDRKEYIGSFSASSLRQ